MKKQFFRALLLCLVILSCQDDDGLESPSVLDAELMALLESKSPTGDISYYLLPNPDNLESIPADPNNPITAKKVELGKLFFHETALGRKPKLAGGLNTYSCASCHQSRAGFQAGIKQGLGEGGEGFGQFGEGRTVQSNYADNDLDIQPIRTPPALNLAFQDVMLWNGQFGGTGTNAGTQNEWAAGTPKEVNHLGFEGIETQAIAGFDVHRLGVDDDFFNTYPNYKQLLDEAFPLMTDNDRYSSKGVGLAMAAYERTIISNEAPFQKWLSGQTEELSLADKRGAIVFFGKGNCVSCHSSPALNDMDFYALGMGDLDAINTDHSIPAALEASKGRGGFTKRAEDEYKFKTPQLYNLKDHQFFGHGGTFESIEAVIRYKNNATVERSNLASHPNLAEEFVPLGLTDDEIGDLVSFLTNGLFDTNLDRHAPESVFSGGCVPNNDDKTRQDLGCQ